MLEAAVCSITTADIYGRNISNPLLTNMSQKRMFVLETVMRSKARINECCVGFTKVVSFTVLSEPLKSPKHLIPVKRFNWLIGTVRYDALSVYYWKKGFYCEVSVWRDWWNHNRLQTVSGLSHSCKHWRPDKNNIRRLYPCYWWHLLSQHLKKG